MIGIIFQTKQIYLQLCFRFSSVFSEIMKVTLFFIIEGDVQKMMIVISY